MMMWLPLGLYMWAFDPPPRPILIHVPRISISTRQVKLEKLEADLEAENPWERVISLVDLQVGLWVYVCRCVYTSVSFLLVQGRPTDTAYPFGVLRGFWRPFLHRLTTQHNPYRYTNPKHQAESPTKADMSRFRALCIQLKNEPAGSKEKADV